MQFVGCVQFIGVVPFLALISKDLGMLLGLIVILLSESRKWRISTTILTILLHSIINYVANLFFRIFLRRIGASYPRELFEIT